MRGQQNIGQALQGRDKALTGAFRLLGEYIDGGTHQMAVAQCSGEGIDLDYRPRALLSRIEFGFMARISASPIMFRVSSVWGTCRLTMSDCPRRS